MSGGVLGIGGVLGGSGVLGGDPEPAINANIIFYAINITIDGFTHDGVTEYLSIEREINAAATARFKVLKRGADFNAGTLRGKAVSITATQTVDGVSSGIEYYGFVVTADNDSLAIEITCSDNYQEVISGMPKAAIDAVIPGYDGSALYDHDTDNYDYALRLLRSAFGVMFLNATGELTFVPWSSPGAGLTFDAGTIDEQSIRIQHGDVAQIKNKITITFEHAYLLLWYRKWLLYWNMLDEWEEEIFNYAGNPTYPSREMIEDALQGMAFGVSDPGTVTYADMPATQNYVTVQPAGPLNPLKWVNNDLEKAWCLGFSTHVLQRWVQRVTAKYVIIVQNAASITAYGEKPGTEQYSLAADESQTDYEKIEVYDGPPSDATLIYNSSERDDWAARFMSGPAVYAKFEAAIQCVMAEAAKEIAESHWLSRMSFSSFFTPAAALGGDAEFDAAEGSGNGKIAGFVHSFSLDDGNWDATTSLTLKLFTQEGGESFHVPIHVPNDPVVISGTEAVTLPLLETHLGYADDPPLEDNDTWTGYVGNRRSLVIAGIVIEDNAVFRPRFAITLPDIPDVDRDEITFTSETVLEVMLPGNDLTERNL